MGRGTEIGDSSLSTRHLASLPKSNFVLFQKRRFSSLRLLSLASGTPAKGEDDLWDLGLFGDQSSRCIPHPVRLNNCVSPLFFIRLPHFPRCFPLGESKLYGPLHVLLVTQALNWRSPTDEGPENIQKQPACLFYEPGARLKCLSMGDCYSARP